MNNNCNCAHCRNKLCLHKVPIFAALSKEDLYQIADLITHKEFKKRELILHEGDKTDSIVIINEGSVKAFKYTSDGREQILYIFSEGDFFGEQNLLTDRTATFSAQALSLVKTCTLSKANFQQLIIMHPEMAIKIIAELSNRMSGLEKAMQGMSVRNLDFRLSTILLEFAEKYGAQVKEGILVQMPLSREGIANYLGVARETISRKLGQMEDDGLIRSVNNKSILILIPSELEKMAGLK